MSRGEDKRAVSFLFIANDLRSSQYREVSKAFGSFPQRFRGGILVIAVSLFALLLESRGAEHPSCYPKIPVTFKSKLLRFLIKPVPPLSKLAFHGCYGGPGNDGGRPLDPMDELFRRHDIVYVRATSLETLLEADRRLAINLQKLEGASFLTPDREAYRLRAIKFLLSPKNEKKGKPFHTLQEKQEHCHHLAGPEAVARFFHHSHPALPELEPHQLEVKGSSPPRVKLKDFLAAWPD